MRARMRAERNCASRAQTTRAREENHDRRLCQALACMNPHLQLGAVRRRAWHSPRGKDMMAREDMIRQDMQLVGTYNAIFEPTIKQLAKTERELSRAEKEWKKQGGQRVCTMVNKTGAEYTAKSPYWTDVQDLRATVQALRNQLGLTPTGLNKARSKSQPVSGTSKLERLLEDAHNHAVEQAAQYQRDVDEFVQSVLSGESGLCEDAVLACKRYVSDLDTGKWDFRAEPANDIIAIIETMICHQQGEFLDATPLRGTPFLLLPYHKFIVYNVMGFYMPGTKIRRFKEAVDFIPRKNVKTTFAAALAFALALYERASGSKVYEVGGALKQALEGFDFLKYNAARLGVTVKDDPANGLRIIDNNMERSISGDIGDGMISINALAANPDKQDSFNCNIVIADEAHTYKSPQQYQILKDATKAYTNKLVIIISSNGPNARGFLLGHLEYCRKILRGTVTGNAADSVFCFLCSAPTQENGDVDLTDPAVLRAASPGWGYSIRPQDMINDAAMAAENTALRPEFLNKSLNVTTNAVKAWFDIAEFRKSDERYDWTMQQLAKLPIRWYGGTDLSKLHDLTAGALFGHYKGVDIIIPHCWFPRPAAMVKAQQDQIPLFGWQEDGWLEMTNDKVTNHHDVVAWYKKLRSSGFKIRRVGHDRKFCREYYVEMKQERFQIKDQPQLFTRKSEGFRYIEASAKRGTLYYLHAEPFEYCVQNVAGIEKADDMVMYQKIEPNLRIDVFDAAVFAVCAYLEDLTASNKAAGWYDKKNGEDGDAD